VFERSAKSLPISPEMKRAFAIAEDHLTPAELIRKLLTAEVDLLFFGGIGTFVKAHNETHAEVGDRANDAVRVDGEALHAKVVGEGANLGVTQRGRVAYALKGGHIDTDAIDNSAGVDMSDHEVNIKILLGLAIADGEMTEKQRNVLLAQMTNDVAALVLRDNYFQTQALAIAARMGTRWLDQQARFMRKLEKTGLLNRALEFLPADDQIAERKERGAALTAPELAVLLAYSKMWLFDELLGSDVPEDPWIGAALARYFPAALRERFATPIARHPLKREIIATHVLNSMINRVGATFVHRLTEVTGAQPPQIVRAYLLTREIFDYVPLWQQIEALDDRVPVAIQSEMIISLGRLTTRATTWFVRSRRLNEPMQATFTRFAASVAALRAHLAPETAAQPQVAAWAAAGVPLDLAQRVALTESLFPALDIAEIAEATGRSLADVGAVYAGVAARLGLAQLQDKITELPSDTYWQGLALAALADDLTGLQRALAQQVVALGERAPEALLAQWATENALVLERTQRLLAELTEAKHVDLAMLSVALRELRNLV